MYKFKALIMPDVRRYLSDFVRKYYTYQVAVSGYETGRIVVSDTCDV